MPKQQGGAGRGQGRPLTPEQFTAMVARIGRMVARLEKQEKPEGALAVDLTLATVNLNASVNRLMALLSIDRPPELTDEEREASHEWAVRAVQEEEEREATVIGWQPYVPAQDMIGADGKAIPAGASVWREVLSDGSDGAVVSRVDDE